MRRRQRRLHSWWRHEQQSSAMALAACETPQHAAERRSTEPDDNHQGQGGWRWTSTRRTTATDGSSTKTRPGTLAEPGPQGSDRSQRHSSGASFPSLSSRLDIISTCPWHLQSLLVSVSRPECRKLDGSARRLQDNVVFDACAWSDSGYVHMSVNGAARENGPRI